MRVFGRQGAREAKMARSSFGFGIWSWAILALALSAASPAVRAADPKSRIVYAGKLEDGQGRPIGGIYPLTFSFFKAEKGGRALWSETHFVAVDNGVYAVELGRTSPLPRSLDLDRAFLGVAVNGGKEILRERFTAPNAAKPANPATPSPAVAIADPTIGAPRQPAQGTFADRAGFADEADHAKNADAIGGMSAADVKALAKQLAAPQGGKVKIGAAKRFTDPAGGTGGTPFSLQCPPGYVVTGIKGQAAAFLDQIQVICSPLE